LQQAFAGLQGKSRPAPRPLRVKRVRRVSSFWTKYAQRDGVVYPGSGLQYEVVNEGTGATPQPALTCRLTTRHLDHSEVFRQFLQRGQPAEFPVGGVIAGWTEALQL